MFKNFFRNVGIYLASMMKGGDNVLSPSETTEKNTIVQQQESQNLGEALLKGQITQQVQDLRYSNYAVSRESEQYKYIGEGKAEKVILKHGPNYSFTQPNKLLGKTVLEELERVDKYADVEKYTFDVIYDTIPRVHVEPYIEYGKLTINKYEANIDFYISESIKTQYDPITVQILKELEKIRNFTSKYQIENNELCSNVKMASFVTNKANGENDMIKYILNDLQFVECKKIDQYYVLSYFTTNFQITDLIEQFYSEQQDKKYKNHAAKAINPFQSERHEICEECGNKVNIYDADIVKATYNKVLCIKCLEKYLQKQEN